MATRDDITAWVNPTAWDDVDEAERAVDAIEASGSDDEAEWVRLAGGSDGDALDAAVRDAERAEQVHADAMDALKSAVRTAREAGMTKVEIARRAGVTRPTLDAWLAQGGE